MGSQEGIFVSEDRVKRLKAYAEREDATALCDQSGTVSLQPEELLALVVVALQGLEVDDRPLPEGFVRPPKQDSQDPGLGPDWVEINPDEYGQFTYPLPEGASVFEKGGVTYVRSPVPPAPSGQPQAIAFCLEPDPGDPGVFVGDIPPTAEIIEVGDLGQKKLRVFIPLSDFRAPGSTLTPGSG